MNKLNKQFLNYKKSPNIGGNHRIEQMGANSKLFIGGFPPQTTEGTFFLIDS